MISRPDSESSRRDASIGGVRIDFEEFLRFLEPKTCFVVLSRVPAPPLPQGLPSHHNVQVVSPPVE